MNVSPFERSRPEECLSDLALDRLVGEDERSPHLDVCARCSLRHRELREARDRFIMPRMKSGSRRHGGLAVALAASVAALIFWPEGHEGRLRQKGGPRLSFYVKHGENVRRGNDGDKVAPKDAIRFAYSAESPYHVAVLSVDPAGAVSIYYPAGDRTRPEAPGADVALPLSTVLDESLGTEEIFALFCEGPIDLAAAKSALESSRAAPSPEGCVGDRLGWVKEP